MNINLKPIKSKKIYEQIVEQIKQLVINGQLQPGDRLPSERELVKSFKVSRSCIREALSALETMNLIEVRTGEGSYIRLLDSKELFEARKIIEVQATYYAAKRISDMEIKELEQILYSVKSEGKCIPHSWESADHQFHASIVTASHNRVVIQMMDHICQQIRHLIRRSSPDLYDGRNAGELMFREHEEIYRAIKNRDAGLARYNMLKHLMRVEEGLWKGIEGGE